MENRRQCIINIEKNKKVYFTSDQHFNFTYKSIQREILFINWLDSIQDTCHTLFILGDLFEFWYEYKYVIPKGMYKLLNKLDFLSENGINIYIFKGNHDLWLKDYISKYNNIKIINNDLKVIINNKKFLLTHGDGKGKKDKLYKIFKYIIKNKFINKLIYSIHPDITFSIAKLLSNQNRRINEYDRNINLKDILKEDFIEYSLNINKDKLYDFIIYGHRHLPMIINIDNFKIINLGDWINFFSYGVLENNKFKLKTFNNKNDIKYFNI